MLGSIRKHSTWLWGIIIAAMAVSLVVVFQPTSHGGGDGRGGTFGMLFGREITGDELLKAQREVILQVFLQNLEWQNIRDEELTREGYKRLFLIRKQETLGIHVSDDEVTRRAAIIIPNLLANAKVPRDPSMSPAKMWEAILAQGKLTMDDFVHFLRHDIGQQQLVAAVSLNGQLVTTNEVRSIYERDNQQYHAEAAFFVASNFLSEVVVTPAALSEFYSNHVYSYEIKERVQVSYVAFEATNHWAEAGADLARFTNQTVAAEIARKYGLGGQFASLPNLSTLVDAQYRERTNIEARVPERPRVLTGLELDKAKEIVRSDIQHMLARGKATQLAGEFANPLLSTGVKVGDFAAAATKQGLAVKVSAPFDSSAGPEEISKSPNFASAAFALNESEPIAGPMVGDNAAFVIAMNKRIPAETPAFDAVKTRVEADFKLVKSITAARAAGVKFAGSVSNEMAAGKTFGKLCAEAKARLVLLPSYTLTTQILPDVADQMSLDNFMVLTAMTPVNSTSPSIPTQQGAMVLRVQNRLPVDEKKAAADLPGYLARVRNERQQEAFQRWFAIEASRELGSLPFFRRQAEMGNSGN